MEITIKSKKHGDKTGYIDDVDLIHLDGMHLHLKKSKDTFYIRVGKNRTFKYLHRIIMGHPIGLNIDHKNHNGLDNRRDNLRVATKMQNCHNMAIKSNSKSGFKGVIWVKETKTWNVVISANGIHHFGGAFKCKINAAIKYNEMAIKYHGEFAFINVITNEELASRKDEKMPSCGYNRGNSSGYRGVFALKNSKKWQAQIVINRKPIYGGIFETKEEAARRYNELALLHHKEKAILNKV
jgi:AP2 domain